MLKHLYDGSSSYLNMSKQTNEKEIPSNRNNKRDMFYLMLFMLVNFKGKKNFSTTNLLDITFNFICIHKN